MRILMINHEFTITGASTIFFRLAMHLRRSGHDITILPVNPEHGPMADRYAAVGIPIETRQVTREFNLAIANTICAAPLVLQFGPQIPIIWNVTEAEIALRLLMWNPTWAGAFARAAHVVYQTAFQHDVFRSFTYMLDPGKFHTIPCGVDVDVTRIARERVPPKTGIARIVQVGTIEQRKRPGDLIRAVARLAEDVECVICGKLIHIATDAKAIIDANPKRYRLIEGLPDEEILAWTESADIFVLASNSETQGIAAYEAALLARPLILSDLLCYRGVFSHGRNCLLFPPGNVDLLALSLRMLMQDADLARTIGSAAQKTAVHYSNRAFFANFDALLQQAMA